MRRHRRTDVNPVDVKVRASSDPGGEPKIVGYDAAVTLFRPGYEGARRRRAWLGDR